MEKIIVGITGASGSIYGITLVEQLLKKQIEVHMVCTDNGKKVIEYELEKSYENIINGFENNYMNFKLHNIDDMFSSIASGSFKTSGMVIAPCSMATLGEISTGVSKNLLGRAADVCIKEKRKLVLVPRETPFNTIHLKNMLNLSKIGVTILPAMPGFYNKPKSLEEIINFMVGRILDEFDIDNDLFNRWGK
ncbi:MAG: UbiX family flavin prenyltransferase [Clostridiaceae bacterium]|jgi:4-hydroxy-3-polyprenylbenzoate decarboxylase|nr:UbiX family flavin prenyltransferase [Clostridiaceae bacterium]